MLVDNGESGAISEFFFFFWLGGSIDQRLIRLFLSGLHFKALLKNFYIY